MALGIHILAYAFPMDAGPFGATLLTVQLNPARRRPWTPAMRRYRCLHSRDTPHNTTSAKAMTDHNGDEGRTMVFETIGTEPLDAMLRLRLTASEKERLREDADLAGLSMSELVRRRYFGRPIIANADAIMIKELRRLGGLLKHIHNESNGVNSKETAEALIALKAYIENLSDGRQKN